MSTLGDINTALRSKGLPETNDEGIEQLANTLDSIRDLKSVWKSKGGEALLGVLKGNCASSLAKIVACAKGKPTLDDLLACVHEYNANLSLLATLQDVSIENEIQNQLDESIKEIGRLWRK